MRFKKSADPFSVSWRWLAVALLSSAVLSSGCALQQDNQAKVRIELPRALLAGSIGSRGQMAAGALPTSLADFNCFVLNVSGKDIPASPSFTDSCPKPGHPTLSLMAGLFKAGDGASVDLMVPAGTARTFQLLAVATADGQCPDLAQANGKPHGYFSSVYQVGSTTQDIAVDSAVSIDASISAASAADNEVCVNGGNSGGGSSAGSGTSNGTPPTLVLKSYVTAPNPSTAPSPVPIAANQPVGGELPAGYTQATASEKSLLGNFLPWSPNTALEVSANDSMVAEDNGGNAAVGHQALAQIVWDITPVDLAATPYVSFQLQYAGGSEDEVGGTCYASGSFGASSYLYRGSSGNWTDRQTPGTSVDAHRLQNSWVSRRATDYVVANTSDGKKYLIASVISNYSSMSSSCRSSAWVDGATLRWSSTPEPIHVGISGSATESATSTFNIPAGGNLQLQAWGGVGALTWSPTPTPTGAATLSPSGGGIYISATSSQNTSFTISVGDGTQSRTLTFNVTPPTAPLQLMNPYFVSYAYTSNTPINPPTAGGTTNSLTPTAISQCASSGSYPYMDLFFRVPSWVTPSTYSTVQYQLSVASGTGAFDGTQTMNNGSLGSKIYLWQGSSWAMQGGTSFFGSPLAYNPVNVGGSWASNMTINPVSLAGAAGSGNYVVIRLIGQNPYSGPDASKVTGVAGGVMPVVNLVP